MEIIRKDLAEFFVTGNLAVLDALKKINTTGVRTVFCVDEGMLLGVLTDSDVRRWIINGGDLTASVKEVMNVKPVYLEKEDRYQARHIIQQKNIDAIPIVDAEMHIVDIVTWADFQNTRKYNRLEIPVVMMAGGKGTRLYPYTKILPKPLIPMGEIPIAEHIINQFYEYGCKNFFLIVNHKKNMIKAYFNEIKKDYNITFIEEEKPLGTGGGVRLLKNKVHETFILTNCDILIQEDFSEIYKHHKESGNVITMICAVQNIQIPYGVVKLGEGDCIESMEEKPNINFYTNTGCYIVEPEVIGNLEDGAVVGFPDIIEKYRITGCGVGAYIIGEDAWLDMGQMDGLEKMQERLRI